MSLATWLSFRQVRLADLGGSCGTIRPLRIVPSLGEKMAAGKGMKQYAQRLAVSADFI